MFFFIFFPWKAQINSLISQKLSNCLHFPWMALWKAHFYGIFTEIMDKIFYRVGKKSCFLIYLLIWLLYENKNITIIFQSHKISQKFYCFDKGEISIGSLDNFSDHFRSGKTYLADSVINSDKFQEFNKVIVKKFY
jgi:hypothetical protein